MNDDRGNKVQALSIPALRRAEGASDTRLAALAGRLKNAIRAESRRLHWIDVPILLVALVMLVTARVAVMRYYTGGSPFAGSFVFWGGVITVSLLQRARTRRRAAVNVAATAIAEGLCGSCTYSLQNLVAEPDGRITCPECGAAWNPARITQPHWETDAPPTVPASGGFYRFITGTPSQRDMLGPDDRGRFVRIADSYLRVWPASRRAEIGVEQLRGMKRRTRRIGRVRRSITAALVFAPGAFFAFMLLWLLDDGDEDTKVLVYVAAGVAVVFGGLATAVYLGRSFIRPVDIAPVLVSEGRCACCGRSLADLPTDREGFVVCPECRSSWRRTGPPAQGLRPTDSPLQNAAGT